MDQSQGHIQTSDLDDGDELPSEVSEFSQTIFADQLNRVFIRWKTTGNMSEHKKN
jgi:hypothetical protein